MLFRSNIAMFRLDEAATVLDQAIALNPNHRGVVAAGDALIAAEAEAAAIEELWSTYTPEQRTEFEALLLEARRAWDERQLGSVEELLGRAAAIAPDIPMLLALQQELTTLRETVLELITDGNAAVAQSPDDLEQAGAAVDLFNEALELDPANQAAADGLSRLSALFLDKANAAIVRNEFAVAEEALNFAVEQLPEQEEITALLAEVPALKTAFEADLRQQIGRAHV